MTRSNDFGGITLPKYHCSASSQRAFHILPGSPHLLGRTSRFLRRRPGHPEYPQIEQLGELGTSAICAVEDDHRGRLTDDGCQCQARNGSSQVVGVPASPPSHRQLLEHQCCLCKSSNVAFSAASSHPRSRGRHPNQVVAIDHDGPDQRGHYPAKVDFPAALCPSRATEISVRPDPTRSGGRGRPAPRPAVHHRVRGAGL